jgi:hypothetical protein
VVIEARDDASGVAELRYRWSGGAWQKDPSGALSIPPGKGPHLLEFQATDVTGRESQIWAVPILSGGEAPASPAVKGEPGKSLPAVK